jgi:hypothetical protein
MPSQIEAVHSLHPGFTPGPLPLNGKTGRTSNFLLLRLSVPTFWIMIAAQ